MCQYYVAKDLEPVKKQFSDFLVVHYIDYILFSAPSVLETQHMFDIAQQCLKNSGLIIAHEKIQISTPCHYLGFVVNRQRITPQLTQIRTDKLSTLNDFQKLLGDINWIRLFLHQRLGSPCLSLSLSLSLIHSSDKFAKCMGELGFYTTHLRFTVGSLRTNPN